MIIFKIGECTLHFRKNENVRILLQYFVQFGYENKKNEYLLVIIHVKVGANYTALHDTARIGIEFYSIFNA